MKELILIRLTKKVHTNLREKKLKKKPFNSFKKLYVFSWTFKALEQITEISIFSSFERMSSTELVYKHQELIIKIFIEPPHKFVYFFLKDIAVDHHTI